MISTPAPRPTTGPKRETWGVRARPGVLRIAFLVPVIVTALYGCDNVTWGGADLQVVPPPPPPSAMQVESDTRLTAEFGLPSGSVLFHLVQGEGGSTLLPVAELRGDSLRTLRRPSGVSPEGYEERFRETVIPAGSQFDVYRRGARVGTFVVQGMGPVTPCGVPTATGNTTVVAAAADVPQFLAFRRGLSPEVSGDYSPPQVTGSIRTYASIVAERLILQQGLPRPRSWQSAQADLEAIEIAAGGHPEMAATYLVGDQLEVGPAGPSGYSVFYLADYETRRGYMPVYQEVRDYRQTGKAAPQLVDYLDWDSNEGPEILVRVFGVDQIRYEALSQRNSNWTRIWEGEPCG